MTETARIYPKLASGIVKQWGTNAARGHYIDSNWVRFVGGLPQKIGGYVRLTTSAMLGKIRGTKSWNDLTAATQMAAGTSRRLYWIDNTYTPRNITPYSDPSGTSLTNKLTTAIGSPDVSINETGHGMVIGNCVTFPSSVTIGGITLLGDYFVTTVTDVNNYKITTSTNATSAVTSGGGTFTIKHEIGIGPEDPGGAFGWGAGTYGTGTYSSAHSTSAANNEPRYWSLDNFGKILLAAPFGGKLYSFDPTASFAPAALAAPTEGPGAMRGMFITPERYVVAWGASPDTTASVEPMTIRWTTQGDYTVWVPTATNTANIRRLTRGKRIMGASSLGAQISLIWTDTACYAHQYTGASTVFNTRLVGINCGLAGPMAYAVANGQAFWMSTNGFYLFNGGVVKIPKHEDIADWFFSRLRLNYETKAVAFYVEKYSEVWFCVTDSGSAENTYYAMVNLNTWDWAVGTIDATSWTAFEGSDNRPIIAKSDGYLYQHENGLDANGAAINAYITCAPSMIGSGKQEYQVLGFDPDFGLQVGDVTAEFVCYNEDTEPSVESYTITAPASGIGTGGGLRDTRMAGRLVGWTIRSNTLGGNFSLGLPGLEVRPSGARR